MTSRPVACSFARALPLLLLSLTLLNAAFCLPAAADPRWMGDYLPLELGATWTYQNVEVPADMYAEAVFENLLYEGDQAVKYGSPDEYRVVRNAGGVITVYAFAEDGVLFDLTQNIVLGTFTDGGVFETCIDPPCDTNLIRDWETIDPALRVAFSLDAAYGDVVLLASYDRGWPPNAQNLVAESNLPAGITPPAGAITGLEWYQRDLGMVAVADVDAASGTLQGFYRLSSMSAAVAPPAPPLVSGLRPPAPNPTRGAMSVCYALAQAGRVQLDVYDVSGRLVRRLVDGEHRAGVETVVWNGTDRSGAKPGAGVYFVRLVGPGVRETRRVILLR